MREGLEGGGYSPENDALPEPEGGYTEEYIEAAIKRWEVEIEDMEVKRDAVKLMVEEGHSEREEELEDFNRQIKVKQAIIEKARIKLGEIALKKEIETGKYE